MQEIISTLNKDEFDKTGVLFPLPALSTEELKKFMNAYSSLEDFYGDNLDPKYLKQLHLFFSWAYDLVTHPTILNQIEQILGPDILVHSSSVFSKKPGGDFHVPWHQDGHYIGLDKSKLVSAWVALSDSNIENGCLRVIPETHLRKFKHTEKKDSSNMLSSGLMIGEFIPEDKAVDVQLRAGEMSLHHVDIVHGSNPNLSNNTRIGFAIRYVAPEVKQELVHYNVVLARGVDRYGHYDLQDERPVDEKVEKGVAKQKSFYQDMLKRRQQFLNQKNVR